MEPIPRTAQSLVSLFDDDEPKAPEGSRCLRKRGRWGKPSFNQNPVSSRSLGENVATESDFSVGLKPASSRRGTSSAPSTTSLTHLSKGWITTCLLPRSFRLAFGTPTSP